MFVDILRWCQSTDIQKFGNYSVQGLASINDFGLVQIYRANFCFFFVSKLVVFNFPTSQHRSDWVNSDAFLWEDTATTLGMASVKNIDVTEKHVPYIKTQLETKIPYFIFRSQYSTCQ